MKKLSFLIPVLITGVIAALAQSAKKSIVISDPDLPASQVDFDAFDSLTHEVKEYRKNRLITLPEFIEWAKETNTIILDTRSAEMYKRKHLKGAVHLNFSDFTQANLRKVIPSKNTRILIYCNNNFADDERNFALKSAPPPRTDLNPVTLALNIPTFINLYGYGYRNVYELSDLVSVLDPMIRFEGTEVGRDLPGRSANVN